MTRLVLVHGRDPGGADADRIESLWLASLNAGLEAAGLPARAADDDASFVFYDATLDAMVGGQKPPPITVHAADGSVDVRTLATLPDGLAEFALRVVREVLAAAGADGATVEAEGVVGDAVLVALAGALAAIDRLVPAVGGAAVLLFARDVYAYLHDDAVREVLDAGLAAALPADEPAVVVAHSLGSVVAYRVLRAADAAGQPAVPLLLTLGSPMAVRAIRDVLAAEAPLRVPTSVDRWIDARDPRDLLAVHGLTPAAFPLEPGSGPIGLLAVDNRAPGHHSAAGVDAAGRPVGYLADAGVARLVGAALGWSASADDSLAR